MDERMFTHEQEKEIRRILRNGGVVEIKEGKGNTLILVEIKRKIMKNIE